MQSDITRQLEALYGRQAGPALRERLDALLSGYGLPGESRGARPLTEGDAMLITYGDQVREPGVAPLRTLGRMGQSWWRDLVNSVHILPFYPSSSDDGFAVIDYAAVDPALGDWEDIRALASDFELMFDAVFNHMSARSEWFRLFLMGDPEFEDFFVTVEGDPDLSAVVRPRALPLITECETARGKKKVWTTFSADQVDLNLRDPEVLLRLIDVLLFYVSKGACWIRLDAIAYLWKEPGTNCIHRPETHRIVQLLRAILDEVAPWVRLITETNVPHSDNISYFGDGTNEAQLVYNFALPPLVLHTIGTGNATALCAWARTLVPPSAQVTFFNFLASHDGIGLNPARGLLTSDEIEALVNRASAHGGYVSYKHNPDGSRSPYELNINFFDALSDPDGDEPIGLQVARFLCAQSILLALQGVPGIYVHSLLGSRGDRDGAASSGMPRRINRAKLDRHDLERELNQADSLRGQVFRGFSQMLRTRRRYAAFRPDAAQEVLAPRPELLVIKRGAGDETVWCVHNISAKDLEFDRAEVDRDLPAQPRDQLGAQVTVAEGGIRLPPYAVFWLGP